VNKADPVTASAFLTVLVKVVAYKIRAILIANGLQFRLPPRYADGPAARFVTHMFEMRCQENGIEQRVARSNE
jgi:hypothetical protein